MRRKPKILMVTEWPMGSRKEELTINTTVATTEFVLQSPRLKITQYNNLLDAHRTLRV